MAEPDTQMADLLFELGTEELPPVALKRLSEALGPRVRRRPGARPAWPTARCTLTPHRAAWRCWSRAAPLAQPDREIERRGPAVQAAFDADGKPTQAAEGFARSCGTTVEQLGAHENGQGRVADLSGSRRPASTAAELLPALAETALNRLPIPKRMRWGASEAQFVRPVHWLVFLHGAEVVPCTCSTPRPAARPRATASITRRRSNCTPRATMPALLSEPG